MFDGKSFLELKKGKFTGIELISLYDLSDDLKVKDTEYPDLKRYDVMEIYKPEYNIVAKREKEVKEITMAEVEEKFGCKVKIIKEEN